MSEDRPPWADFRWDEEERAEIVNRMMEVCAEIRNTQGIILLVVDGNGKLFMNWTGVSGLFSGVKVLGVLAQATNTVSAETTLIPLEDDERTGDSDDNQASG